MMLGYVIVDIQSSSFLHSSPHPRSEQNDNKATPPLKAKSVNVSLSRCSRHARSRWLESDDSSSGGGSLHHFCSSDVAPDSQSSLPISLPVSSGGRSSKNTPTSAGSERGPTDPLPTSASSGSTRGTGKHSLDKPFLVSFAEYLSSRAEGKRKANQVAEICTDVSKYLWHAAPTECNPAHLLSRRMVRSFVQELETGGIGPSGVLSKLQRRTAALDMRLGCFTLLNLLEGSWKRICLTAGKRLGSRVGN